VRLEHAQVALAELRVLAQLDVVGAGRGVGDDAVALGHAHARRRVREDAVEPLLQQRDRLGRRDLVARAVEERALVDRAQRPVERGGEVGERGTARVEGVRGAAVEVLRDLPERRGPARLEQLDHLEILVAHAVHELADRIHAAELCRDVALDLAERGARVGRVERERRALVVGRVDARQLAELGGEERGLDVLAPLDRVEDADPLLGRHDAVGERADAFGVGGGLGHPSA
jgi:hypothetical protein